MNTVCDRRASALTIASSYLEISIFVFDALVNTAWTFNFSDLHTLCQKKWIDQEKSDWTFSSFLLFDGRSINSSS